MNIFEIPILAANPADDKMVTAPLKALVNTESELTWLPGTALRIIGVSSGRKLIGDMRTKQQVERDVGQVILFANGHRTRAEVVFAEPGDAITVGLKTLEGFGVQIDDPQHGFIALATLTAFNHKIPKAA